MGCKLREKAASIYAVETSMSIDPIDWGTVHLAKLRRLTYRLHSQIYSNPYYQEKTKCAKLI